MNEEAPTQKTLIPNINMSELLMAFDRDPSAFASYVLSHTARPSEEIGIESGDKKCNAIYSLNKNEGFDAKFEECNTYWDESGQQHKLPLPSCGAIAFSISDSTHIFLSFILMNHMENAICFLFQRTNNRYGRCNECCSDL